MRSPSLPVILLLALASIVAVAETADAEYFVSVGSYREYGEALTARDQADERLPESFSVAEADLDSGRWYRVLAGPYLTREIAEHMLTEARRVGFDSPWILMSSSVTESTAGLYPEGLLDSEPPPAEDFDLEHFKLGVPDSEPMDIPGFNVPARTDTEQDKDHKLVDEAPDDYFLNRLRKPGDADGS